MKVIFFGTGRYYENKKSSLKAALAIEIIAFIDNDAFLWGGKKDGITVVAPEIGIGIEYDYIVIMSDMYHIEMRKQLLDLGVFEDKILDFDTFMEKAADGSMRLFLPKTGELLTKKILFITASMSYSGGILAVLYAAMRCREMGYQPVVMAPSAEERLIEEFREEGILFCVFYNVCKASMEQLNWLGDFSCVFVNTFQMRPCVEIFVNKYPVIWWIHEPVESYIRHQRFCYLEKVDLLQRARIFSVSSIAKKNLQHFFPSLESEILTLGIPDCKNVYEKKTKDKLVFAVIGRISEVKGQDILMEAVKQLPERQDVEFWMIGPCGSQFAGNVKALAKDRRDVRFLGMKTRKELEELYQQIDVIVVCSREETLSIVAIEAMVYEKTSIVSDACGVVAFLEGKEAELVYHYEAAEELKERIWWCVENREELEEIGKKARSIYEKHFAMDVFGERIKEVVENIING